MKRFLCIVSVVCLCGCNGAADRIANPSASSPSPVASLYDGRLQEAAGQTYSNYMRDSVSDRNPQPSDEIPAGYWADAIKALMPIRVYKHRANIVVVQRVSNGVEEGKYIYNPISSYMPMTEEVDGFTFLTDPDDPRVYNFKRVRAQ